MYDKYNMQLEEKKKEEDQKKKSKKESILECVAKPTIWTLISSKLS